MSNINLLPWREARALRQKKQFGVMLGIFMAITHPSVLPLTGWWNSRSAISSSATSACSRR